MMAKLWKQFIACKWHFGGFGSKQRESWFIHAILVFK